MLSVRSATWTIVLIQLVLAAAALIASVAIVAAQAQTVSRYGVPQKPSPTMAIICVLCFGLVLSTICAMFGLSAQRSCMLLPLIIITLVISVFETVQTVQLFFDWFPLTRTRKSLPYGYGYDEPTAWTTVGAALFLQGVTIGALYLEVSIVSSTQSGTLVVNYHISHQTIVFNPMMDYQVVLASEMVLLITGETAVAMVHGWTEGIGYALRQYYTPMWTCAMLMIQIFLLILSLFSVFVGLHFNRPGIVKHHVVALVASWPLSLCIIIGGIVSGAPFLVGFVLLLYFSSLLPFAYIYGSAEWKSTELPSP